jgi:hypothetical protein
MIIAVIHRVNHQIKPKTVAVFALDQNRNGKSPARFGAARKTGCPRMPGLFVL